MSTPTPTPRSWMESIVNRSLPSKRVATTLAMVCLVSFSGIAVAQDSGTVVEDWEDGTLDGWNQIGTGQAINEDPARGDFSVGLSDQGNDDPRLNNTIPSFRSLQWDVYPHSADSDAEMEIRNPDNDQIMAVGISNVGGPGWSATDGEDTAELTNFNTEEWTEIKVILHFNTQSYDIYFDGELLATGLSFENSASSATKVQMSEVSSGGKTNYDDITTDVSGDHTVSGTVSDENNDPIENASVNVSQDGSEVTNTTTNQFGDYSLRLNNGTYNMSASKDGYFPDNATVTVSGEDVTQDFELTNFSEALQLKVRPFIGHGQTVPYTVTASIQNSTTEEIDRFQVTDDATVMSSNTSVVTVDPLLNELTATEDVSVNNRVPVTAEWTDPDTGETYSDSQNVTVANQTVDNLKILPPWSRVSASIGGGTDDNRGDRTILIFMIGAAIAAGVSRLSTSFGGLAAFTAVVIAAWIAGFTSMGITLLTVLMAGFVGMNTAGNVDYEVSR